ncbi:MAG: hypothetical protein KGJ90_06245 [Patescibacteria group bacterium]|nr:hypothetical protein [Patescibacteria group bacterium]
MKGFKTFIFGSLIALTAVLSNADMQAFIAQHIPEVGGSIGGIIIALRTLTTSSIFTKGE